MLQKFRYKGTDAFFEEDKNIFWGRETEVKYVIKNLETEKILLLHSQADAGKTSLINAGIIPLLKNNTKTAIYNIDIQNIAGNQNDNLIQNIISEIEKHDLKNSYLDKILPDDNSLWIKLKKLQSKNIDEIVFFFDNFENITTFPKTQTADFCNQLNNVLYSQIPEKYSETIQEKISNDFEILTDEGFKLLYKPLNIKIVFVLTSDKIDFIKQMELPIYNIFDNRYEIEYLDNNIAEQIICKTANYEAKYVSQNNFISSKFQYDKNLISEIVDILSQKNQQKISPLLLQIVCENIEKIAHQKNLSMVTKDDIVDINNLFTNYYDNIIATITDLQQQELTRNFIETDLILEEENIGLQIYQGVATKRYKINDDILNFLTTKKLLTIKENFNQERFYELSNNIFIDAILTAKHKNIENKLIYNKLQQTVSQNQTNLLQTKKIKTRNARHVFFIFIAAFLISTFLAIYAIVQKNAAEHNAKNARANLLASFAFQELEKDPTLSFRLAQEAFNMDKDNTIAYSALITSFYKTNIFYNIIGKTDSYVEAATISNDAKFVLFISNDDLKQKYKVILTDINGNTIIELQHNDKISSAIFSKNDEYILTTCWDSIARVWDRDGNRIKILDNHKTILNAANFSSDGQMIVTAGNDNKAKLWNSSGELITELSGHSLFVRTAEFSHDNTMIVTASEDNSAKIWDIKGKLIATCYVEEEKLLYNSMISFAKFTKDDKNIILISNGFANKNNTVRIFDLNGNQKQVFRGHTDWINFADISEDNTKIFSASRDNSVFVWDQYGNIIYKLLGHKSSVFTIKYIEKEKKIITISFDRTIREWGLHQNDALHKKYETADFASFSTTGINIVTINKNKVTICDLLGDSILGFKHSDIIKTAYISNDYKEILTASSDGTALIWDFKGKIVKMLKGHKDAINSAVFSADNTMYLTSSDDKTAIIWDKDAKIIATLIGHSQKINTANFSKNAELIITASNDSSAKLWNLKGELLHTFYGHQNIVSSASFSPYGKFIITTGNDATARLWKITGEQILILQGYENKVNSAEFSPNGKFILTTSDDKTARLWDLNGHQIMVFTHEGAVKHAIFSPKANYILSVYQNNMQLKTKLWLVDGKEICEHTDQLNRYGTIWKLDEYTKKLFNF